MPRILSGGIWGIPVSCRCLSYQIATSIDVGFTGVPDYFTNGQVAVINSNHNYVFWSDYDTGGSFPGGNERGVLVPIDVTDPFAAFQTDTVPLDLGRLSILAGIDHVDFTLYCLNMSSDPTLSFNTSVLAVIDADSDHDHPAVHTTVAFPLGDHLQLEGDGCVVVDDTVIPAHRYYAACSLGVDIFDIETDPPTVIGSLDESAVLDIGIKAVEFSEFGGNRILWCNSNSGGSSSGIGSIRAYDISDLTSPTLVGTIDTSTFSSGRRSVQVYGNYLYAMTDDGMSGQTLISIYDITDPTAIGYLGFIEDPHGPGAPDYDVQDILLQGVCLAVLTVGGGIQTFDLADPVHPAPCTASGLTIFGQGFQLAGLQGAIATNQNRALVIVPA